MAPYKTIDTSLRFLAVDLRQLLADHHQQPTLEIDSIHDDAGYQRVRRLLSEQHKRDNMVPDIQVARYDKEGDRSLILTHQMHRDRPLAAAEASEVLKHLERLWGFDVRLETVNEDGRVEETLADAA